MDDEWRVEADLDDEQHGYALGERLRARDLDDLARERLGGRVIVTRNESRLFLYAASEHEAREAEQVIGQLIEQDDLSADVSLTRWHPIEESWKDASIPLPATEEERRREYERMEEAETREAAVEGVYDWEVHAELPSRHETVELERVLREEGLPVIRRWTYLAVGALSEEQALERADNLRARAPAGTRVEVQVDVGLPRPLFDYFWHPSPTPPEP